MATASDAPRLGLMLRAAHTEAPSADLLTELRRALDLAGAKVVSYADPRRGEHKLLKLQRLPREGGQARHALVGYWWIKPTAASTPATESASDASARGVTKAPAESADTCLATWRGWLDEGTPLIAGARELLAPDSVTRAPRSRQICTCFDVDEARVVARLQGCPGNAAERLASLQAELRCGSNCGSCLPALRALVASTPCSDVAVVGLTAAVSA
jgi:assimilatory nitrate reductase catalytic subunit